MRVFSLILLLVYIGSEFFFQSGSHDTVVYIFIIWFVSALLCPNWNVGDLLKQKKNLYLYVFIVFYFVSSTLGSNLYKASTSTMFMIRVFAPVLMYDILRQETVKIKRFITSVMLAFVLIYAFMANSLLSKIGFDMGFRGDFLTRGEDVYFETMFAFIYILPVLVVTMISLIRNVSKEMIKKAILIRLLLISISIYFLIMVLRSFLMTAIILIIVGIAIAIFYRRDKSLFNLVIKTIFTLSILVVVFLYSYDRIHNYAEGIGNAATIQRLEEIRDVLTGNLSQSSDLESRNNLRTVSFNTFLSHPLIGVHHSYVGKINESVIGNHAQWIDDLARYGLFSIIMFLFIYYALKKQYGDTKILLPILLYVVIGFLNPISYVISNINMFVLVPLLIESVITDNNLNKTILVDNKQPQSIYE